jgi:hypothetical protein
MNFVKTIIDIYNKLTNDVIKNAYTDITTIKKLTKLDYQAPIEIKRGHGVVYEKKKEEVVQKSIEFINEYNIIPVTENTKKKTIWNLSEKLNIVKDTAGVEELQKKCEIDAKKKRIMELKNLAKLENERKKKKVSYDSDGYSIDEESDNETESKVEIGQHQSKIEKPKVTKDTDGWETINHGPSPDIINKKAEERRIKKEQKKERNKESVELVIKSCTPEPDMKQ